MNPRPAYLMCPPDYFGVEYVINPWMEGNEGSARREIARDQWNALYTLLTDTLKADVKLAHPQPGLPDMVFAANSGLVRGKRCVPARMRPLERRGEEPLYRAWFREQGYEIAEIPTGLFYEGAGDSLFGAASDGTPILWCGYGFRTDRQMHRYLSELFNVEVVSLRLVDPRYYHLDTCFCPLPNGYLLWYSPAFDSKSRQEIVKRIAEEKRHDISDADAMDFACNAIGVGEDAVVLNRASAALKQWLEERGFRVYESRLTEFMKAGGSAKCLSLQLS